MTRLKRSPRCPTIPPVAIVVPLIPFVREHARNRSSEFLEFFDGSFLLTRFPKEDPYVLFLPHQAELALSVGSDRSCDVILPGAASKQFHLGFRDDLGWVAAVADPDAKTTINGAPLEPNNVSVLPDRAVIKPAAGGAVLQYFDNESFWVQIIVGYRRSRTARFKRPDEAADPTG